jgi:hypothetical protein
MRFRIGDGDAELVEAVEYESVVAHVLSKRRGAHYVWDACCSPQHTEAVARLQS